MSFHKISTPGNQLKLRYFTQWVQLYKCIVSQIFLRNLQGIFLKAFSSIYFYKHIFQQLFLINIFKTKHMVTYGKTLQPIKPVQCLLSTVILYLQIKISEKQKKDQQMHDVLDLFFCTDSSNEYLEYFVYTCFEFPVE